MDSYTPCLKGHCLHSYGDETPMPGVSLSYCCRTGCRDLHVFVGGDGNVEEKTHGGLIFDRGGPKVYRHLLGQADAKEGTLQAVAAIRADERVRHASALTRLAEQMAFDGAQGMAAGLALAARLVMAAPMRMERAALPNGTALSPSVVQPGVLPNER